MSNKPPYQKEPIAGKTGFVTRVWLKWFLFIKRVLDKVNWEIITNPTFPYTMVNDNEIIFVETTTAVVINLKAVEDGLRCRVINSKDSTANISLTPNGTDLLYGVNSLDTILPNEARDVDGNSTIGWY